MTEFFNPVFQLLEQFNPVFLLPAMIVLPLFGFPVSLLLVLIGYKFGAYPYGTVYALLVAGIGITLNDALAYWLARTFFRGPILRLLERKKIKVPVVPREQEIRVIALLRITPGTPLFMQNYLLGLANVDFKRYIWISVPIQMIHVTAVIVFGEAIFEGKIGTIIFAVFLLIALTIIFRMVHTQHKAREAKKPAANEG